MQLIEILQLATDYFAKHQVPSPRLNAEQLLSYVLGVDRLQLYLQFDRHITSNERELLRALVRRRAAGEPLQYLTGFCHFYGLRIACDKRAMIPRPETEVLVQLALQNMTQENGHLLDVGTGSGAIALALLYNKPGWQATATDISADALALAQQNAAALNLTERIRFHLGDLSWPPTPEGFDLIVANLPYLPTRELALLPKDVQYEPVLALDGGADGLQILRRLLAPAGSALRAGGYLLLEIHPPQATIVEQELLRTGFCEVQVHEDLAGYPRVVMARRPLPCAPQSP